MNFTKEKIPPVREDRLGACNAFGGTCHALSRQAKTGCLNNIRRSFTQTQGCQLNLSLIILSTIRDTVIIVHGPIGCGGGNIPMANGIKTFQKLRDPAAKGVVWLNTNLDETDLIKGGEEKLEQAILHADSEFRPSAIIVINSCAPGIIGDDIDGLAEKLKDRVTAEIVPVHCEGFKTKIMATAYDSLYHGILRNLIDRADNPVPAGEAKGNSRKVNLLNLSSMSRIDEIELERLLGALGLEARILPCYAHPDDFGDIRDAALNVSVCATHDDYLTGHLREKYGIPVVTSDIPVGIAATGRWLMNIARFFGLEKEAGATDRIGDRETGKGPGTLQEAVQGQTGLRGRWGNQDLRHCGTALGPRL